MSGGKKGLNGSLVGDPQPRSIGSEAEEGGSHGRWGQMAEGHECQPKVG